MNKRNIADRINNFIQLIPQNDEYFQSVEFISKFEFQKQQLG